MAMRKAYDLAVGNSRYTVEYTVAADSYEVGPTYTWFMCDNECVAQFLTDHLWAIVDREYGATVWRRDFGGGADA
jgi:hypothetical protein